MAAKSSLLPTDAYLRCLRSRGSSSDYISRCGISLNSNSRATREHCLSFGKTVSLMSKHLLQGNPALWWLFLLSTQCLIWKYNFYLLNLQVVRWEPKDGCVPNASFKDMRLSNDQSGNKMSGKKYLFFQECTIAFIEKFYLGERIQVSIDIL